MIRQRPHTRTQCSEGNQCSECLDGSQASSSSAVFVAPASVARRSSAAAAGQSSAANSSLNVGNADDAVQKRAVVFVELPAELLVKILNYLSFREIGNVRRVSRRFNEICASMLNSTFQRLQSHMLQRFQAIKSQMPRRESARRHHPLARESDIVETLHMRLTLLQMTFGKHIERKHMCFFAGEILDEVQRIMRYIRITPCLGFDYKCTDELFDLSSMAMEYFKEHLEPSLPEITYFGAEFLDFTSFSSPIKRRSQSGSTSVIGTAGGGMDSPCSSRASVAGSCVSEPWSTASTSATSVDCNEVDATPAPAAPPQSNMVLRKRIRRIRQGMKRYNDQLVEVKRELKTCKTKMDSQTKQVQEYSHRLEEYDKKFEESSRKFQTLLTELNKCKTELQYWRSKSTTLLSLSNTCSICDSSAASEAAEAVTKELKDLANQGVLLTDESIAMAQMEVQRDQPSTSRAAKGASGPASPPASFAVGGRKRRSRDELDTAGNCSTANSTSANSTSDALDGEINAQNRKNSLRGQQQANNANAKNNGRFKRPKMSGANN